jgi:hypothetical protein
LSRSQAPTECDEFLLRDRPGVDSLFLAAALARWDPEPFSQRPPLIHCRPCLSTAHSPQPTDCHSLRSTLYNTRTIYDYCTHRSWYCTTWTEQFSLRKIPQKILHGYELCSQERERQATPPSKRTGGLIKLVFPPPSPLLSLKISTSKSLLFQPCLIDNERSVRGEAEALLPIVWEGWPVLISHALSLATTANHQPQFPHLASRDGPKRTVMHSPSLKPEYPRPRRCNLPETLLVPESAFGSLFSLSGLRESRVHCTSKTSRVSQSGILAGATYHIRAG